MPGHNPTVTPQVLAQAEPAWMQEAVLLPSSGPRTVKLAGPDARDLLQRLTTNDMRQTSARMAVVTALLMPTGKIQSVFTVVTVDDGYILIAGPGEAAALCTLLQRQIFFMDDVTVTDVSADWQVFQVAGRTAGAAVADLGLDRCAWPDGTVHRAGPVRAFWLERLEFPSLYLLCPGATAETVTAALMAAGVPSLHNRAAYHLPRILASRAGYGREFNGDFNPLEIGLNWICAENKGCYPGQEVIARQITYGKVTRQLVLLRLPPGIADRAAVHVGATRVGYVSSTAYATPGEEGYGLAVLRSARLVGLETVTVQDQPAVICGNTDPGRDPGTGSR